MRKAGFSGTENKIVPEKLSSYERDLIQVLGGFPEVIEAAAQEYSPAQLANYVYEVAKLYNKFYHEESILKAEQEDVKTFRLHLSSATAKVIAESMRLLGIGVPERM